MRFLFLLLALLITSPVAFADSYTPASMQIVINQGEDFAKTLQLKTCSAYSKFGACTGQLIPVNVNGFTFRASAKKSYTDLVPFINFSTSVVSSETGVIKISLSKMKTINLIKAQTGYFDLLMQEPDGSLLYLIKGTFATSPTATH